MQFEYFLNLYNEKKPYEFNAKNMEEWQEWRTKLRKKLINLLGGFPDKSEFNLRVIERREFDEYFREKIIFNSSKEIEVYGYLLIPKNTEFPNSLVIAIPGHGYGMKDAVGINPDGSEKESSNGYMKDFGLILVKNGFMTFVIEQLGFGERREERDIKEGLDKSSCRYYSFWALMLGKTLIGLRVWDLIRTVDLFIEEYGIKENSIGVYGISGGGTTALFASALDDRIKATIISGYLSTFKDSILAIPHCECNYIPKILNYAEMYNIASLIAPRNLFIEHGKHDHIFPIEATIYAFEKVKRVYEFLGVPENIDFEFFEGGHEIWAKKSISWLKNVLKGKSL